MLFTFPRHIVLIDVIALATAAASFNTAHVISFKSMSLSAAKAAAGPPYILHCARNARAGSSLPSRVILIDIIVYCDGVANITRRAQYRSYVFY